MASKSCPTIVTHGPGQKMVLDVRPFDPTARTDESTRLEVVGSTETIFKQQPAGADQCLVPGIELAVQGNGLLTTVLEIHFQVVL